MKYLLDVNVLISGLWSTHSQHQTVNAWLQDKAIVLCPIAELGFIRVSSHPRAIRESMDKAREVLDHFIKSTKAEWIPDDLPALQSRSKTSEGVTDHYLADLASKHGLKFATLDGNLLHAAVE